MIDYIPFLMWGVGGACTLFGYSIKLLWDIRDHLTKLNGKIATCEELRRVHDANDVRQHDACEERLEVVERKLMGTS